MMFRKSAAGLRVPVTSVLVLALLLVFSVGYAQESAPPAIPPEVSEHAEEWPLANLDYANTRNATSNIDAGNVSQLGVAWSFPIPSASFFGSAATNPIVINGVVYFEDLTSHVFALNLEDGSTLWDHDYDAESLGPNGVAVGWGKVFAINGATGVAALDMTTGEEIWTVDLPLDPVEGIDIQPSVYDNLVYVSSVPGVSLNNFYEGGGMGELFALNQETGEIVWQFNTIDSEDIWGNPEVNSGGGAWYSPAIDTDSGMTYWSVANPAPWPGTEEFPNASSRPGPNLYTNSLVALSHDTGEMAWYTQVKPHDLFDLDLQLPPILGTANVNGTDHNVVFSSGKLGVIYAFDRDSGEILWSTSVGEHQNDLLQAVPEGYTIKVLPGNLGGVETPMALASDGILYAALLNQPTYYTSQGIADTSEQPEANGQILAIDVNTGAILWNQDLPSPSYGAATVVNDLVFTATFDGTIYAFDRHTGEQVWSWVAPTGVNGWPAVVGDTIIWPAGSGPAPQIIALRLGAQGAVEATAEATAAPETTGSDETSVQAEQTAMPEQTDAEATSSPISQGNVEATAEPAAEATMAPDMNMQPSPEATEAATSDGSSQSAGAAGAADDPMAQYISVDAANQTVNLLIQAGMGTANGGLNFNGRDHGGATITVPEGWTVHVFFTNVGTLPHSSLVVTPDQLQEVSPTQPAFEGASTENPTNGTAPGGSDEYQFTAGQQGDYVMLCGIPGHGLAGQWLHFVVGAPDVQPSFVTSEPESATGSSGA